MVWEDERDMIIFEFNKELDKILSIKLIKDEQPGAYTVGHIISGMIQIHKFFSFSQ